MFPILEKKVNGKRLVYLDNAATSLTPKEVTDEIITYYHEYNSNVHRGIHTLSNIATEKFEHSRAKVAEFIGANKDEIVFSKGTTESLNIVANSLKDDLKEGDEILLSIADHHSNIVPWQVYAEEKGASIRFMDIDEKGNLLIDIRENTKIIALSHISNVLGKINPIKKIREQTNAIIVVDGAQSVPHIDIDVKDLGCDFLAFSSHKMCGAKGLGILYGKKEMLEKLKPLSYGGNMISEVTQDTTTLSELPARLEAGTPNIPAVIALSKAVEYIQTERKDETALMEYAYEQIAKHAEIYGDKNRIGPISFNVKGIHPHDLSTILDRHGVAIRGGHHCAMPLMKRLGINGCARASFYFYNTKEDVDTLIEGIKDAKAIFNG